MRKRIAFSVAATLLFLGACSSDEQAPTAGNSAAPAPAASKAVSSNTSPDDRSDDPDSRAVSDGAVRVPYIKSVKIFPTNFSAADNLEAIARCDDETLPVEFVYTWYVNGEVYPFADKNVLPVGAFERGDTVVLEVTPLLDQQEGKTLELKELVIPNAVPRIESSPGDAVMDANGYTYTVVASDADGDPLSYFVQQAPEGMVVDADSGVVSWTFDQVSEGEVEFKVGVRDDHEGEVLQSVRLKLGTVVQGEAQ